MDEELQRDRISAWAAYAVVEIARLEALPANMQPRQEIADHRRSLAEYEATLEWR